MSIFNNQCAVKINPKANFPSKICRSRRISTIASYVLTKGSQKDRIKDEGEKERGGEGDRETEGERQRERERKRWEREIRRGRERGGERRRAREKHRQRDSRRGPLLIQLLRVIETHTKTESRRETDRQIKCYLTKQTHFFLSTGELLAVIYVHSDTPQAVDFWAGVAVPNSGKIFVSKIYHNLITRATCYLLLSVLLMP